MNRPKIAAPDKWLAARRELLAQEKEFNRLPDQGMSAGKASWIQHHDRYGHGETGWQIP